MLHLARDRCNTPTVAAVAGQCHAAAMQDDLFAALQRDAGKGARPDTTALPWAPVPCRTCGTPTERAALSSDGRCSRCVWAAAGEAHTPWVLRPGDAGVLGSYVPALPPFSHQLSAVAALQGNARALLMEMGTGKSKVIIDDWAVRVMAGQVLDLLVIAPRGVYRNWEGRRDSGSVGELGLHLNQELLERTVIYTWRSGMGMNAKRRLEWFLALSDARRPRVLLLNVESLSTVRAALDTCLAFATTRRRCVVAIDESTRIRSHEADRTKAVLRLGRVVPQQFKRIATGLPTPRSPLDLYTQFEFIDWHILGFQSYFGLRGRHAVIKKMPVGPTITNPRTGIASRRSVPVIVGYRHLDELRDKVADSSFRVTKDQCLDLPPKLFVFHDVELTTEQRSIYEQLRTRASADLGDGHHAYATEILPRLLRMQQVLCGFVVDEEGVERDVPSNRLDDLVEILGDTDAKVIVWAPYLRSLRDIVQRLTREFGPRSTVRYWGEIRDDERLEAIHRFQTDSETRFFCSNPATGGLGNTLTAAGVVVYYANSPDLEHRLQSEDRVHRAGLTHPVTYVDMRAPGTIDDRWIATLRRKMDLSDALTGDQPRAWLV